MANKPLMAEAVVQNAILDMLLIHRRVAWCMVITTGVFKVKGGGHLTTGHYLNDDGKRLTGMSDILGQLTGGRLFAIEVKRPGEKPTKEQLDFISLVNRKGGVAGWADNVHDAKDIIEEKS